MSYQLIDKSAQLTWAAARCLLSQEGRLGRQVTDTTPPSQTYLIFVSWNIIWNNEKNKHNCKYSLTARLELTRYLGGGMHCLPRLVFSSIVKRTNRTCISVEPFAKLTKDLAVKRSTSNLFGSEWRTMSLWERLCWLATRWLWIYTPPLPSTPLFCLCKPQPNCWCKVCTSGEASK